VERSPNVRLAVVRGPNVRSVVERSPKVRLAVVRGEADRRAEPEPVPRSPREKEASGRSPLVLLLSAGRSLLVPLLLDAAGRSLLVPLLAAPFGCPDRALVAGAPVAPGNPRL
jgi:hypothetical protein